MANQFLNAENLGLILKDASYSFKNEQSFLATATHTFDQMFKPDVYYNPGKTVQVRLPNTYLPQEGDTVTVQDIQERSVPLQLEEILSVPLAYTTTNLLTSMGGVNESWKQRVLYPAVRSLSNKLNQKVAEKAAIQTNCYTGDETANINAYSVVDNAGVVLDEHACSRSLRRYCSLAPRQAAALRQSATLQNSFVQTINKDITLNSQLGRLASFDMFMDQSIAYHTTYTEDARAGVTVKTDVAQGATTIVLTGLTPSKTGIVKAGDVFSFTGIKGVNPITKASTGQDFQLVAAADANSDVSGDATVTIYPPVIYVAANQPNANTFTQIIATTPVVFVGNHTVNMAWSEEGLIIVCPKLPPMDTPMSKVITDPDTGYSMRLSKSAEILNNKNIMRLDILYGIRWLNDRAVRILSL